MQLLHYNNKAILSSSSLMKCFVFCCSFNLSQLLLSEQDCLLKPSKNDKSKRLFFWSAASKLNIKARALGPYPVPNTSAILNQTTSPSCNNSAPLNLTQSGSRVLRCSGMQQLSAFILTTALSLGKRRKCSYLRKGRLQVADQTCLGSWKDIMIPVWQGYRPPSSATVGRVNDAF